MSDTTLDVFQTIADPNRRYMLELLSEEMLTINALAAHFDMSRPAVSKHVKVLHEAGFITIESRGRERYCELNQAGFDELQEWFDYFDKFWQTKLGKLGELMDAKKKTKKRK